MAIFTLWVALWFALCLPLLVALWWGWLFACVTFLVDYDGHILSREQAHGAITNPGAALPAPNVFSAALRMDALLLHYPSCF